jgi:hypothetical protein
LQGESYKTILKDQNILEQFVLEQVGLSVLAAKVFVVRGFGQIERFPTRPDQIFFSKNFDEFRIALLKLVQREVQELFVQIWAPGADVIKLFTAVSYLFL